MNLSQHIMYEKPLATYFVRTKKKKEQNSLLLEPRQTGEGVFFSTSDQKRYVFVLTGV